MPEKNWMDKKNVTFIDTEFHSDLVFDALYGEDRKTGMNDLVVQFRPMILTAAKKAWESGFHTNGLYEYQDVVNVGIVAFITAVQKFDHSLGLSLATYAGKYVRNEIKSWTLANTGPMVLLKNGTDKKIYYALSRIASSSKNHTGQLSSPVDATIAEEQDVPIWRVRRMRELYNFQRKNPALDPVTGMPGYGRSDNGNKYKENLAHLHLTGDIQTSPLCIHPIDECDQQRLHEQYLDIVRKTCLKWKKSGKPRQERMADIIEYLYLSDLEYDALSEILPDMAVKYDLSPERIRQIIRDACGRISDIYHVMTVDFSRQMNMKNVS